MEVKHLFVREAGVLMYSENLAGGDAEESRRTLSRLKSAAGWTGINQYQETPQVHRGRVMRELDGPLTVMPSSRSAA